MRLTGLVPVIVIVIVLVAEARASEPEPWKVGVTPAQMQTARRLLDEGNALLLERDYTQALVRYEQAITEWDHPAIRFNIVRCLIQLDRIVEASDNLDRALKYGAAPLEETVYREALAYKKLFANQIATVSVGCQQQHVDVTLDGKPLITCPGSVSRRLLPGAHQFVGKRTGFLTRTADVVVLGGTTQQVALSLDPVGANGKLTHRWATVLPWAVVGAGLVVAGSGIAVQRLSTSDRDDYYARIDGCDPTPCPAGYAQDRKDRAILENRVAIGIMTIGAAAIVTGGVLVYMNRGRLVYPEQTDRIIPTVTPRPDGGTVGVTGRF